LKKITLVNSRTVFIASLVVAPTLILIVYVTGLKEHRSFYLNSLISTPILSIALIGFLTVGLYNGWKVKDTVGRFTLKYKPAKLPDLSGLDSGPDGGDHGIGGIIIAIFLWLVVAIFGTLPLYYVVGFIWLTILSISAI